MRGDKCAFDHGPDPVVIENSALEKIVSRGGTTTTDVYNPMMNPPPPGVETSKAYGGASGVEGYNPEAPALTAPGVVSMDFSVPPPPLPAHLTTVSSVRVISHTVAANRAPSNLVPLHPIPITNFNPNAAPFLSRGIHQQDPLATSGAFAYNPIQQDGGPYFRRDARGGGRFRPYGIASRINPALCSLLVKGIPPEQNKIVTLDQHFGKFGQITNLHVQYEGRHDTALVTFKSRREALNAYKSTEPILNNRFIKVFWQTQPDQPTAGSGSVATGANTAAIEAPQSNLTTVIGDEAPKNENEVQHAPVAQPPFSKTFGTQNSTATEQKIDPETIPLESAIPTYGFQPSMPRRPVYNPRALAAKRRAEKESLMQLLEVHRRKTELYQKQMEQQKAVLVKIQQSDNKDIKKKFLDLVKKLDQSAKATKAEIEQLGKQIGIMQENQQKEEEALATKRKHSNGGIEVAAATKDDSNKKGINASTEVEKNGGEMPVAASTHHPSLAALNNKKLFRVVLVSGCPASLNDDLIVHMEKFGDLFDFDITPHNPNAPYTFTYKDAADAQKAVAEASSFSLAKLKVEWAPNSQKHERPVVPDGERKPDQQMTPAALLASLDDGDDEEEDTEAVAKDSDDE